MTPIETLNREPRTKQQAALDIAIKALRNAKVGLVNLGGPNAYVAEANKALEKIELLISPNG